MPNTLYKAFQAEVVDQKDSQRTLWATASLEEPDREGDVILADGWELENYRKNPVILFAHKYDQPPVARALEIGVSRGGLRFKAQFPGRKEYPFADTIYKLYRGGYLRSFSVGFIPKLWEDRRSSRVDVAGPLPSVAGPLPSVAGPLPSVAGPLPSVAGPLPSTAGPLPPVGRLFRRQELVEISVVPIPTHPRALAEAQKKGLLGQEEARVIEDMTNASLERETLRRLELLIRGAEELKARAALCQEETLAAVERAMEEFFVMV